MPLAANPSGEGLSLLDITERCSSSSSMHAALVYLPPSPPRIFRPSCRMESSFFLAKLCWWTSQGHTHSLPHSSQHTSQSAIERRAASKTSKYRQHCAALGARFIPFILDSYGSIGVEALLFIDVIESETPLLGMQDPLRISKASFLSSLSHQWQSDNAAIVKQWLREIRSKSYISV